MTAQKGEDLLLKVDSDGGGTFVTVGSLGLVAFGAKVDDATADESGGCRSKETQGRSKGGRSGAVHGRTCMMLPMMRCVGLR